MERRDCSLGIFQISDSNEASFIAHRIKSVARRVTIKADLIDLKFIDAVGGRETQLLRV